MIRRIWRNSNTIHWDNGNIAGLHDKLNSVEKDDFLKMFHKLGFFDLFNTTVLQYCAFHTTDIQIDDVPICIYEDVLT